MKREEKKVFKFRLNEADLARIRKVSRDSAGAGLLFLINEGVKHLSAKKA
jgi:hypothetical protein